MNGLGRFLKIFSPSAGSSHLFLFRQKSNVSEPQSAQQFKLELFDSVLTKELQIKSKEDWYRVKKEEIIDHDKYGLLDQLYDGSLRKALEDLYPDHKWLPWKFDESMPLGKWREMHVQRDFMDYLAKELNIKNMEDWYHVTKAQMCNKGATGLLKVYDESPSKTIASILVDHHWDLVKFSNKPKGTWDSIESQREFLNQLAKQLNIKQMEDWYNVTKPQIHENGGGGLLRIKYHNSPSKMITSLFPEHNWNLLQFHHVPKGTCDDVQIQKEIINNITKQLKITKMEDWYGITAKQIRENGGAPLLMKYQGSPKKMITAMFPEHVWQFPKFLGQIMR
eukprot:TRINITY_DN3048_c0_g1_i1.p2 TRINITY_DN3048_c0_g1~~TRINITY_DN3048_c0_g1_i1.p2  ORF type:complete len:336 (+),score=65.90 TRINITY_DN3048_c0_g1_i1:28-1035(+)